MSRARPLLLGLFLLAGSCAGAPRAAVDVRVTPRGAAPSDALVYVDEELVGPLGWVQGRTLRLRAGTHRISVVRSGYFPWDRLVEADREPLVLEVELVPIPD